MISKTTAARAFTLIELLIVVAIIAILAAIAVPNFLEAQTRAKVSRVHNDLRNIAHAMEMYYVDNRTYPAAYRAFVVMPPISTAAATDRRLLTTPIAYISSVPYDIFRRDAGAANFEYLLYGYHYTGPASGSYELYPRTAWMTWSMGPDRTEQTGGYRSKPTILANEALPNPVVEGTGRAGMRYDPSNGTISTGDIYRFSAEAEWRQR